MRQRRHGHIFDTRPADWGSRERHPLYRCWNSHLRYHAKVTSDRWKDFWKFVEDIGESRPSTKHRLTRMNDESPFGPENFYWREPSVSGDSEEKKKAHREYMRGWYDNNRATVLSADMRKRYGITWDDYQRMLDAQGSVCAICHKPETRVDHRTKKTSRLAIDHCHKTNVVRGLLCHSHNNSLGHFDDDPTLLTSAIAYLAKHSSDPAAILMAAIANLQAAIPVAGTG